MSESQRDIAIRLGSAFSLIADRFLPALTEGVSRSKKKITFGATVEGQMVDGVIALRLVPHAPKIPTEEMDAMHFVLRKDASGQLAFAFEGTIPEMKAAADELFAEEEIDPYTPGDNATPAPEEEE